MSSPHVAGIAALMLQKNPSLTGPAVESILEASAIPLPPGCRTVATPFGTQVEFCWEADATGAGLAVAHAALALTHWSLPPHRALPRLKGGRRALLKSSLHPAPLTLLLRECEWR